MTIIPIPYALIANVIAGFFIVRGFLAAEERGRIVIVVLAAATLIVPRLFASGTVGLFCFVARVLVGIGCAMYVKFKNAAP